MKIGLSQQILEKHSVFFRWLYSPLWALACRTIPLPFSISPTLSIFSLPALEDLSRKH